MNKNTEQYKQYIGHNFNASVEKILRKDNPTMRVIKTDHIHSTDVQPTRLNVKLNDMNQIVGFNKG